MKTASLRYSLAILLCCISSLAFLAHTGKDARTFSSPAVTIGEGVPDTVLLKERREVFRIWKERGLRGRTVLHFANSLSVTPSPSRAMEALYQHDRGKIAMFTSGPDSVVANNNYILFAMADEIARKVFGVVPQARLAGIEGELTAAGYARHGTLYRGLFEGTPKIITAPAGIPRFDEPVLLDFDAGFFANDDVVPEDLCALCASLKLKTDLATFSLSEGEEGVTQDAIRKMKRFMELMRGGNAGTGKKA